MKEDKEFIKLKQTVRGFIKDLDNVKFIYATCRLCGFTHRQHQYEAPLEKCLKCHRVMRTRDLLLNMGE